MRFKTDGQQMLLGSPTRSIHGGYVSIEIAFPMQHGGKGTARRLASVCFFDGEGKFCTWNEQPTGRRTANCSRTALFVGSCYFLQPPTTVSNC